MKQCELCGQRVKVFTGSEGTNSYTGCEAEELQTQLAIAREALEHISSPELPRCCLNAFRVDEIDNHYHQIASEALARIDGKKE